MSGSRSKKSGGEYDGPGARNLNGVESEQSKARRKKKKYQDRSTEEVVKEMKGNKGRYVGTKLTGSK